MEIIGTANKNTVNTADYWETYWALTKAIKIRFDSEGISIPFPQRDIHVIERKPG